MSRKKEWEFTQVGLGAWEVQSVGMQHEESGRGKGLVIMKHKI